MAEDVRLIAKDVLLEMKSLKMYYNLGHGQILKAVDNINLQVKKGETLGLVGESGCGKSTLGRTIVRLYEPTAGSLTFDGQDITTLAGRGLKAIRRRLQMIFQDTYAALNPRMTVGDIIGEALDIHNLAAGKVRQSRIVELLSLVGLNPEHANRFPHEFSAGQRQRVGIARALAVEPQLIVCDEPISALDVSIQAQVVNLLKELQARLGLTYLFIAHDLSMVQYISDRVAVMYYGKVVELAETFELYGNPLHPYTKALLAAIPVADPDELAKRERVVLQGDAGGAIDPGAGCRFRPRCPVAQNICCQQEPQYREIKPGHFLACQVMDCSPGGFF